MVRPEQYKGEEALVAEARLGMALDCLQAVEVLVGIEAVRDVRLINPRLSHDFPTWREQHGGQIESLRRMRRCGQNSLSLGSLIGFAEKAENLVEDLSLEPYISPVSHLLEPVLPLIVIVGQTASGKSALAMELAEKFGGEIICADSRTIYKGMDIGTAKPSWQDQAKVPHFGLNISTPDSPVTAADFQKLAKELIVEIAARGHVPIMVGGTGLYIDSVLYDFEFRKASNEKLRAELAKLSVEQLQNRLAEQGIPLPENSQNPRHLIRALETGGEIAKHKPIRSNTLVIGLEVPRDELKQRITKRLYAMFAAGLEAEVQELVQQYGWDIEPLKTIGYREFRPYFEAKVNLEQLKSEIIKDTMAYAKRQRTWFKRNSSIHWSKKQSEAVDIVTTFLNK